MGLILKYKKEILVGLGIVALYFTTRLILLGNLPIFTDEAIYTRWAQIASQDASWRFISLTDGKQPMFIWFGMVFLKLFKDPLTAVRLVSVLSGFLSLIGLWFLTLELFKNRMIAFICSLLYVVFPFAVVYDRMALYDSMVGTFAVWAVYFSILLVRKLRLDLAYTLGLVVGGGMLTKTNADFSLASLPFTLLLFNFRDKLWKKNLVKWAIFAFFACIIAEAMYSFLRLSPFFYIIAEKNTIFIYPFSQWIHHPFTFFFGNLMGLSGWLFTYLTPFFTFLILASLVSKKFIKEKVLLILYFAFPFLADALFGKVIFPRHVFFTSLYLLPLASLGLFNIIALVNKFMSQRKISTPNVFFVLITIFFVLYPAKVSLDMIFNPAKAAIANSDRDQYITQWPAGGGVRESINFFNIQAQNQKIYVGTEGTFGLMPAGLEIYLVKNPNITTKGYWPINDQMPQDLASSASNMPTYFIFYQPCPSCKISGDAPPTWPLKLISSFKKSDNVYYSVYQVEQ